VPQLNFMIPADLLDRIDAAKPDYLDRKGFLCLLLDQSLARGLTRGTKLPAYCVGAGTSDTAPTSRLESSQGLSASEGDAAGVASVPQEDDLPLEPKKPNKNIGSHFENKRESKNPVRRYVFAVPPDLNWCKTELLEFWQKYKSGKKTEVAARILVGGCRKIAERYGEPAVKEQLELACGYGWENITLANYERFGLPARKGSGGPVEPQTKHPASREFRNGRFVDEEPPATNPALAGLI
jgi:hypothetical protein